MPEETARGVPDGRRDARHLRLVRRRDGAGAGNHGGRGQSEASQGTAETAGRVVAGLSRVGKGWSIGSGERVMECEQVRTRLWAVGSDQLVDAHLEGCEDCRVEARRAQMLLSSLEALRA